MWLASKLYNVCSIWCNQVYQVWCQVQGVSEKKYGVADYKYVKNGSIAHNVVLSKNNSYLVVCEVSIPYVKLNN